LKFVYLFGENKLHTKYRKQRHELNEKVHRTFTTARWKNIIN